MKRILVPCDFSIAAEEAFKLAVNVATKSNGEVHVLHVIDITFLNGRSSLDYSYAFNLNFLNEMEQTANEKFKAMLEKYSPKKLVVKFRHCLGSLVTDIQKYIEEKNIDLIMMGTHSSGDTSNSTNAQKVVRNSTVPVLVVHKAPEGEIKNIVLPVTIYQPVKRLIDEQKKLRDFFNAKIHLLWVNTPEDLQPDTYSRVALENFARNFELKNYTINIRSNYSVEKGIFQFAREIDADMIAMGTHAWKGLAHLLSDSVSEAIVNDMQLPVWTYAMR